MTKNEKELTVKMLNDLSDILANRCCNDFVLPESWTRNEKIKFVKEFHDWNGDPEEFSEDFLVLSDFDVASLLADKLKSLSLAPINTGEEK